MHNIKKFGLEKKKLIVLSTFGHCGIDWLHSLLDNHKQILIIPSLSFYRRSEILKKKYKVKKNNKNLYVSKFLNLILKKNYTKRLGILKSSQNKILYKKYVFYYLTHIKNYNLDKDLFEAVHFAYAKINNININKKKVIVTHEHLPWNCYRYKKNFNTKFILILRDPRASIAGSIRYLKRFERYLTGYQLDVIFTTFLSAYSLHKQTSKKNLYVIKNENMNLNLKKEMKKLSNWMGVIYDKSLLNSTFLGKEWKGESSYISKGDLKKKLPKNYYNIKNVKKRWIKVLNNEQIKQIETVFKEIFQDFNYKKKYNENFINALRNTSRFIINVDFKSNLRDSNIIRLSKDFIRRLLLIKFNKLRDYFLI